MAATTYRLALAVLALLTLASFAPLVAVVAAGSAASLFGCQLDEGSVHPCHVAGMEIGAALYTGFVLGWLALLTWPGMLVSLGLWLVVAVGAWRRRHAAAPEG